MAIAKTGRGSSSSRRNKLAFSREKLSKKRQLRMESRSHRPEIPRCWTNLAVAALAAISLWGINPAAYADQSDVSVLSLRKSKLYSQVDGSAPTLQTNPFTFQAGANPTAANRITSAQFNPPTPSGTPGAPIAMTNIGS